MTALILVVIGVAALSLLAMHLKHRSELGRAGIEIARAMAGRINQTRVREPDLKYAAEAFASIAIVRKNNIKIDLHAAGLANAEHEFKKGCTVDQALSARWGAVVAIEADLELFQIGVDAYEDTKMEMGQAPSGDNPKAKFYSSAMFYLVCVLEKSPGEYERFLRFINA